MVNATYDMLHKPYKKFYKGIHAKDDKPENHSISIGWEIQVEYMGRLIRKGL